MRIGSRAYRTDGIGSCRGKAGQVLRRNSDGREAVEVAVQSKREVLLRLVGQQGNLRCVFRRLHVTTVNDGTALDCTQRKPALGAGSLLPRPISR